jgi:hypothetical protein
LYISIVLSISCPVVNYFDNSVLDLPCLIPTKPINTKNVQETLKLKWNYLWAYLLLFLVVQWCSCFYDAPNAKLWLTIGLQATNSQKTRKFSYKIIDFKPHHDSWTYLDNNRNVFYFSYYCIFTMLLDFCCSFYLSFAAIFGFF